MTDRLPPHDLVAEQAVLGSLLINRDAIASLADWLKPEAFYDDRNRKVYLSLLWLWNKRIEADVVTLGSELRRVGKLDAIGGEDYLSHLITICPGHWKLPEYAETVRSCAEYRAMIDAATTTIRRAYNRDAELDDVVADFRQAVEPFAAPDADGGSMVADVIDAHIERVEMRWAGQLVEHVVPTGIRAIDKVIMGGFRGGDLIAIGGRPGSGKTSWMVQLAQEAALRTSRVSLIAELEMSREALLNRAIAADAGIAFDVAYKTPHLLAIEQLAQLQYDRDAWRAAADRIANVPMAIETKLTTTDKIRAQAERMAAQGGIGMIFVDHLDYLTDRVRADSAEQRTAELTRRLKRLAQDLDVPVAFLSQLNREVEAVKPYVPSLKNFRNSGAIEQDIDFGFLIYRRKYYVDKGMLDADPNLDYCTASDRHRVELHLAKNRSGEVRTIDLGWQPQSMTFHEVAA